MKYYVFLSRFYVVVEQVNDLGLGLSFGVMVIEFYDYEREDGEEQEEREAIGNADVFSINRVNTCRLGAAEQSRSLRITAR